MPLITTRSPRRQQPQGAARFNSAVLPGLPLVLLSAGAGCRNLAGERYFSNSVSIKPGPDGLGYAFDGTQETSLGLSDPGSLLPCVFFGVFRVAVAKAWSAIMYDRSGVNGATFGSDGLKLHYVWDGSEWTYSTGLTFAVGELVSFAYCVRSDSVSIAMNGKFDKRTVSNSARSIGAGTLIGADNWIGSDPVGGRQFNGSVYLAGLVAGDWRDELLIEFSRNPWQVFAPRRLWLPTSAAGGSLPTLSAATYMPGSLTSSGFRPRVTAS